MRHTSDMNVMSFWLNKLGSEKTRRVYHGRAMKFFEQMNTTPEEIVAAWKKVKYDLKLREEFLDEWTEKIETHIYSLKGYAPQTRMTAQSVLVSFFKNCCARGIPVEPKREKHTFVKYHNRDIRREEIKQILENAASLRDKLFYLMMAESGLRPDTLVQLRFKHIKRDFEANGVPLMIDLPSKLLKNRVEARWTFIGEDGFKVLKEYLKPRLPLQNEDLIFQPERSDVKLPFVSPESFSRKFSTIVLKLGITEREQKGKPKRIRLYCLRKYFSNNVRYEGFDHTFKEFWMGHVTTQTHYVSRDIERHRKEYAKAYPNLQIYRSEVGRILNLERQLTEKDKQISQLKANMKNLNRKMEPILKFLEKFQSPQEMENFTKSLLYHSEYEKLEEQGLSFDDIKKEMKKRGFHRRLTKEQDLRMEDLSGYVTEIVAKVLKKYLEEQQKAS